MKQEIKLEDLPKSKRKARASVLVDIDDFNILSYLYSYPVKTPLTLVRDILNISHNSFLIHIKRLVGYGLMEVKRGEAKDYKTKYFYITDRGRRLYLILSETIDTKEKWLKHFENKY